MVNITTPLALIGAALSRTGTMSTVTALEKLGYKVWHGTFLITETDKWAPLWYDIARADLDGDKVSYQAAMDEGLYDNCNYHSCLVGEKNKNESPLGDDQEQCQPEYEVKTTKHYACTNAMEYFAELSVAFLASPDDDLPQEEYNKWYPHNAKQLKEHDPRAFELLQKLWGVEKKQ